MPTVAEAIERARHRDVTFTPERHTDYVLRLELADYQKGLVARLSEIAPEEFAVMYEIPLPLPDFDAGYELLEEDVDDGESVVGEGPLRYIRVLDDAEGETVGGGLFPVRFIPHTLRWDRTATAPAWVRNGHLYLGGRERDWSRAVMFRFWFVPNPPDEILGGDELVLGSLAQSCYVSRLALFMAERSPMEVRKRTGEFADSLDRAEAQLTQTLIHRHEVSDRVRVVR